MLLLLLVLLLLLLLCSSSSSSHQLSSATHAADCLWRAPATYWSFAAAGQRALRCFAMLDAQKVGCSERESGQRINDRRQLTQVEMEKRRKVMRRRRRLSVTYSRLLALQLPRVCCPFCCCYSTLMLLLQVAANFSGALWLNDCCS